MAFNLNVAALVDQDTRDTLLLLHAKESDQVSAVAALTETTATLRTLCHETDTFVATRLTITECDELVSDAEKAVSVYVAQELERTTAHADALRARPAVVKAMFTASQCRLQLNELEDRATSGVMAKLDAATDTLATTRAEIKTATVAVCLAYNMSSECLEDALRTSSKKRMGSAKNLSCHTVGTLTVEGGKVKSGGATKDISSKWFAEQFGEEKGAELMTRFWCFAHPREVVIRMTPAVAAAGEYDETEIGAGPHEPKRVKIEDTSDNPTLRRAVWMNTVGVDVESHPCPLCHEAVMCYTQPCGFELAHIRSALDGGGATTNNMIATCGGCNNAMGGKDMHTWIGKLPTTERRATALELVQRVMTGGE